jgi:hypothetical protein
VLTQRGTRGVGPPVLEALSQLEIYTNCVRVLCAGGVLNVCLYASFPACCVRDCLGTCVLVCFMRITSVPCINVCMYLCVLVCLLLCLSTCRKEKATPSFV